MSGAAKSRGAAGGLVLLGVTAALALVSHAHGGTQQAPGTQTQPGTGAPVSATVMLDPAVLFFGDTLTARVDVVADRSVVDPSTIVVRWNPAPWSSVRPIQRTVETAGSTAHVRSTYVLRCLTSVCAPVREADHVHLQPARISYRTSGGTGARNSVLRVPLRPLVVHTRVGDPDPTNRDGHSAVWSADLVDFPTASFRVAPWLLSSLLAVLGALLLVIAAFVVVRAWPRKEPEVAVEPEPVPEPVGSALEQALALLERADEDGEEQRRRALELVADEAERAGDRELALDARALAWSSTEPQVRRTQALAAVLRVRLASVLELAEAQSNGGAPEERHNGGR